MSEKVILTNMCLIRDDQNRVVLQDRQSEVWPGMTFPGGKIEYKESFKDAVVREVFEETGLNIKDPIIVGTKQFQTDKDERYIVFLYLATEFTGDLRSSIEGDVFWVNESELDSYRLAPDLMDMYKVMVSDTLTEFYYERKGLSDWQKRLL
ncbi:8-oxo-dGTP diphosphatase [Alkalibacterium olivapovliticus]|uniref:8-oxo-dGTP diphosphatase n=1 Tax=Alkalibacterium olivapovliticus TaxID=99907 RepID=A0A2T0WBT9_9LACT|nr:8-oxo-dGTP diphosphatase [Alkalibacterium olivapovliticus]PRY84171.1 8-oxo-dGTP diphosphatase [Alkalibacterium olivapovliticus]